VLRQGSVPEDTEQEGSDQHVEEEHQEFREDVGLVFGLDDFFEHLLLYYIFFLS